MKSFFKGIAIGLGIGFFLYLALFLYLFIAKPQVLARFSISKQEADELPSSGNNPDNTETFPSSDDDPLPDANIDSSMDTGIVPSPETDLAPPADTDIDLTPDTDIGSTTEDAVLAFAGDVQFSDQYLAAYEKNGISAIADTDMLSEMQGADLFILNEEFPFSLRGEPMEDKQFTFRTDPKYVKIFQDLGADIVTIANNHALDFGQDAFCDTLEALDQAGITRIGGGYNITEASAPAVRTINGQTFAIFGATRVSPSYDWYATDSQPGMFQTYDPTKLNAAIKEASLTYDHVVVFVHWGIERNETPEDYQRQLARGYIESGADLIIGCHPHVLQGFEYYNDVPIVYSLGNYLFGNRSGETLLLKAVFSADASLKLQLVPCQRVNGVLCRIQEPASLYQHLTDLSFEASVSPDGILTR